MKVELSKEEVNKRLVRLRNLEHLYVRAKKRIVFLEKENKQLRQRVKELEDRDKDKDSRIEPMSFQLEQIKNKLFGKKPIVHLVTQKKDGRERDVFSYQRPIPNNVIPSLTNPSDLFFYPIIAG